MLYGIKDFTLKKWLLTLISILIMTDIVIILNIPFLREIMVFVCFTTIPGILVIHILRLNKLEFLKKVVLSVGLSIAFLIFIGLVLNSLHPLLLKPLSLVSVFVSLNAILIILALIAYIRNKNDFSLNDFLNFRIDLKDKVTSMLIFPFLFPLLAILGTYLMNTTQNNTILIVMLFLIPIYLITAVLLKNRLHEATYPVALWMIGLSLLLMHGLTSGHIVGRDVHMEYYSFNLALDGFHWDVSKYRNPYNACLSITILPVIYKVLSNINGEYIFKVFFALIGSVIPLVIYIVSEKYVGRQGGFFAALLFVFQTYFIYILGISRQEIAFLFFFLAILVLFESNIGSFARKFLVIVLMVSVIMSHYATAYFSIALIIPILLLPFIKSIIYSIKSFRTDKNIKIEFKNFDVIAIIFAFITFWYLLFARVQADAGSFVASSTIAATAGTTKVVKDSAVLTIFGTGLKSVPNLISVIINDLIFIVIAIGIIFLLKEYIMWKKQGLFNVEEGYLVGILVSVCLLIAFVVLPYISTFYGPQRLFLQILIFLAPFFVIGATYMARIFKRPKISLFIMLFLIISIFTTGTYLQYHFCNAPYSPYYEKDSALRDEYYIYDQEIIGAEWLKKYNLENVGIQADGIAYSRLFLGYIDERPNRKITNETYLYLGNANINKKLLYDNIEYPTKITDFNQFIKGKDRIYDNGGSEILIGLLNNETMVKK